MARVARVLSESGIYHVMTRSFPDKPLFYDDEDKEKMLQILRKLQIEENFKVYAYCLMDTHIRDGSLKISIFLSYHMEIMFRDLNNGNNYKKL